MDDFIDRKELEKKIKELMNDWKSSPTKIYVCKVILTILGDKKQLPSADTERHAHWCYRSTNRFYECNYCGNITYSSEDKYCSSCGCKMDEVVGNE